MGMTRTWTWLVLMAGLLAVAACSSDSKDNNADSGPDGSTGDTETTTESEEETEDTATDDSESDSDTEDEEPDDSENGEPDDDITDGILSKTDGVLVIDDFEGYADDEALAVYYPRVASGNDITFSLDEDHKNSGSYGVRVDFTLGSSSEADTEVGTDEVDSGIDYAGVYRTISQSWEGAALVRFWVDADVMGRVVVVQFVDAGSNYWEYEYPVESVDPYIAEITMDQFVVPPWQADTDKEMDLSKINAFNLYMRGTSGESTIYLDDFEVVDEATADSDAGAPEDDAGTIEDTDTDTDTGTTTEDTGTETETTTEEDTGTETDTDTGTDTTTEAEDTDTGTDTETETTTEDNDAGVS